MTKRYFYRDPADFLHMAKHYNVQGTYTIDGKEYVLRAHTGNNRNLLESSNGVVNDISYFGTLVDRIYIRPESHHILLPQAGDLVQCDWGALARVKEVDDVILLLEIIGFGKESNGSVRSWVGSCYTKIILRNGQHFFYPEEELTTH